MEFKIIEYVNRGKACCTECGKRLPMIPTNVIKVQFGQAPSYFYLHLEPCTNKVIEKIQKEIYK